MSCDDAHASRWGATLNRVRRSSIAKAFAPVPCVAPTVATTGGKKIWGRKRHLLVDTQGWLLAVKVHAADVSDQKGARQLLAPLCGRFPRLELMWADRGYRGHLRSWVAQRLGCRLVVLEAPLPSTPPFPRLRLLRVNGVLRPQWVWPPYLTVHPKRWLVERSFAWLIRCRRLARDYEGLPRTSEAFICLAFLRLMLVRLSRSTPF
jgi:putative transposase